MELNRAIGLALLETARDLASTARQFLGGGDNDDRRRCKICGVSGGGETAMAVDGGGRVICLKCRTKVYKTRLCKKFRDFGGACERGSDFQFAHGTGELRRHPKYRTVKCRFGGACPYGEECQFSHEDKFVDVLPDDMAAAIARQYYFGDRISK